ncbi:MAG: flagellar filament capping protein FliD [Phycisphaerae bacterium]
MGTISSGIGLISGLDYESIVEQLIALEARPRDRLLMRIGDIDAQRTAYLDISARISAFLSRVSTLARRSFFTSSRVSSSNSDVLSVTADENAVPGSYDFIVRSLATTHQVVSRGFATADAQLSPGLVTIESARARVNAQTRLDELNGYNGVQRASFQIIDGQGNEATVNLSDAVTLSDVLDRINEAPVNVSAEVRGDGLVLTETTGGALRVRELNDGHVAADLGFGPGRMFDAGGRIEGNTLVYLANTTPLSALNDGNGVRRVKAGGDFTISGAGFEAFDVDLSGVLVPGTRIEQLNHGNGVDLGRIRVTTEDAGGQRREYEIDLSGLSTVGEIKDVIEGSLEGVTVALTSNRLVIGYSDNADDKLLKIEDISGNAARDLRIEGESDAGRIDGGAILHMDTLADVVAASNYASSNDGSVTASIDGTRLAINGGATVELTALNGSKALLDLGFEEGVHDGPVRGRRIIGGLDSALLSSLNGGRGFEPGRIRIQVGASYVILDLSDIETLRGVIERINEAAQAEDLGIEAGYDHTGTRLVVSSIDGLAEITISDVAGYGSFAADIGLAQDEPSTRVRSDNLQLQYVSESTRLDDLNSGRGVVRGTIKITNSLGLFRTFDLAGGNVQTLQDVIDLINADETFGVNARINDTGDGLVIEDTAGGELALKIEDESGTAARDLNLLGESAGGVIDGSYEINIELSGSEALSEVVDLINEQGGLASASILNDGTDIAPYRLQVSSTITGLAGELLVDGLDFTTLSAAQDAKVVLGTNADSGVLITSSSNTLTDVVPGLTIDLAGVSDEPVTVTVSRDLDTVTETFQGLVSSFNAAIERIEEVSGYDAETETRGILLGEGTLRMVERRLVQMVTGRLSGAAGNFQRLSDVGIRLRNGQLELDEEKLLAALESHPDEMADFFADEEAGLAAFMEERLESITEAGGLIDRREGTLERQKELIYDRVEVLNGRLDRKRERLMRQFLATEAVLAELQAQQTALAQLSALAGSFSPFGSGSA